MVQRRCGFQCCFVELPPFGTDRPARNGARRAAETSLRRGAFPSWRDETASGSPRDAADILGRERYHDPRAPESPAPRDPAQLPPKVLHPPDRPGCRPENRSRRPTTARRRAMTPATIEAPARSAKRQQRGTSSEPGMIGHSAFSSVLLNQGGVPPANHRKRATSAR